MRLGAIFGTSTPAIGAAAAVVTVVVGGVIGYTLLREDPAPPASDPAPEMVAAPTVPGVAAPEAQPVQVPPSGDMPGPDESAAAPAEPPAAALPPAPPGRPALAPPSFDQVRVAPGGNTVIAGRAPSRAEVELRLDGAQVSATRADAGGSFAALLLLSPSDQPRILTVVARVDGQEVAGADRVIIAPFAAPEPVAQADPPETPPAPSAPPAAAEPAIPAPPAPEESDAEAPALPQPAEATPVDPVPAVPEDPPAPASPAPGEATAAAEPATPDPPEPEESDAEAPALPQPAEATRADPVPADPEEPPATVSPVPEVASAAPDGPASADMSDSPVAPAPARPASPESADPGAPPPPAVVIAGPEGVRVSRGAAQPPVAQTAVQIDAISYDTEGAVFVSGRGTEAARLRVYLNNQPIRMGEIGPGGSWSLNLPDVDPGTYTLRVTELGPSGEVASEIETPFLREDPARVSRVPPRADGVSVVTVQPGFTLWGIAEDNFGEGMAYVQIFEENRDQIRDPHWIFPGQIFRLPELPGPDAAPDRDP